MRDADPVTRRAVAAFGHAPGLWLVYREPLPRTLWRANAVAAGATVAAAIAAAAAAGGLAALLAWGIGHAAWGTYLAVRLPPRR